VSASKTKAQLQREAADLRKEVARLGRVVRGEHVQLLALFDGIDDLLYVADTDTHELLYVNSAFKRLFGDKAVGRKCHKVLQNRDAPCPFCTNDKILGEHLGECCVWEFRNEVTGRWFRCADKAIRWVDGRIVRFEIAGDITRTKQAQDDLRWSEERFRLLAEALPDVLWVSTPGLAETIYVSPAYETVWGRSCESLYSDPKSFANAVHPDDRARVTEELERNADGDWCCDYRIVRPDGQERWIEDRGFAVRDEAGNLLQMCGVARDVTERKRHEEERTSLEAQLRHAQKLESMGTLAGGVAHEINNPITGIMNYAELIQDGLGGPGGAHPELAGFAKEIVHETERVAVITRNLLAFAREDRRSRSPARMIDIVEATLSLIRTVIRRDQIRLDVDVPEDLPKVECRSQQIQQVLMNLMTNARDALNERYSGYDESKLMTIRAGQLAKGGRHWLRVTVEDGGVGIAADVRPRIFDPFFTTKMRQAGAGLGLAISHGIVQEHDGELHVESEPGEFTRFHLDLPVPPNRLLE